MPLFEYFDQGPCFRALLADNPDIVIATPSRALGLLQSKVCKLLIVVATYLYFVFQGSILVFSRLFGYR